MGKNIFEHPVIKQDLSYCHTVNLGNDRGGDISGASAKLLYINIQFVKKFQKTTILKYVVKLFRILATDAQFIITKIS
jgi:hypothetical protein